MSFLPCVNVRMYQLNSNPNNVHFNATLTRLIVVGIRAMFAKYYLKKTQKQEPFKEMQVGVNVLFLFCSPGTYVQIT